jgi:hypothetical protein
MRSGKVFGSMAVAITMTATSALPQEMPKDLASKVAVLEAIRQIAERTCPTVSIESHTTKVDANAKLTATLPSLWKALLNVGGEVGAQYESNTSKGVVQLQLASVLISTNQCRVDVMNKAIAIMFAAQPTLPVDKRVSPDQPLVMAAVNKSPAPSTDKFADQHPLPKPIKEATAGGSSIQQLAILKIFLKNNLTQRDVIALAKLLPQYDVRMGASGLDPLYPADTIFVTRSDRHKEDVLALAAALKQLGVVIKSVQDTDLHKGRLLEVGTYLSEGGQTFRNSAALDFVKLASLPDELFWKAAYNRKVMCSGGPGHGHECSQAERAARRLQ